MAVKVETWTDVTQRKDVLKQPFVDQHARWRELDGFDRMDATAVEESVWKSVSKQNRKWTIIKSDVPAINLTTAAFLLGDGIAVTALPKDATSVRMADQANIVERLGQGVWEWIGKDMSISLENQIIRYAVTRGHLVGQWGWLAPNERGEVRETVQPQERFEIPGADYLNQPRQRVTREGRSPVFIQVWDPLDCYWQLGKDDRVMEVVHEFRANYSQLCELYPDLANDGRFDMYAVAGAYNTALTVIDYWNDQINAIVIEGHEYKKPTPHGYGKCPFTVELVNPQLGRDTHDGTIAWWGTPFCLPIMEHVKSLSWADSISATYMEEIAFALLQHKGIRTTGARSPHIIINPKTKEAEYAAEFDFSADSRVKPMYDDEHLEYLQPPRLVDMLQEFKAARMRDIQLLTYAEGILTGVYNLDISGHSVAQQKQAAMARLTPYILSINRFASRLMTDVFALFPQEWDRIGPFLIDLLVDGVTQQVAVTRELFSSIRRVNVNLKPKVPVAPEAEMQFNLQANQAGVYSLRRVMEKSGVEDPGEEMKQIAYERMVMTDPTFMQALAREKFKELGYADPMPPPPQAPAAGVPPQAGAMAGPAAAMPPGPPMAAALPPQAGMAGPPALPPPYDGLLQQIAASDPALAEQVLAAYAQDPEGTLAMLDQLMAQMGGGAPMGGGPPMGDPMMSGAPPGMMV